MKKSLFATVAPIIIVILSSCSSNGPKEISPTSTDFISGDLAKYIEVVDEPSELSFAEKDGVIVTQFIKLKVKLRLTKESQELQKIDARDISFTSLLSVAVVNLVDENDTKVQDLEVRSEDLLKLKKLLQGKEGDEEIITFQGEFHNADDAPKWFEQAAAFTPYLTGDIESVHETASSSFTTEAVYQAAIINDPDGYTNVRAMPDGKAKIVAKIVDGERFFFDEVPGSNWVKVYRTADSEAQCIGYMHNSRVMPVGGGIASMTDDEISIDDEGDPSVDRFLDEYENFFDHYMSYIKKMNKDDPTFMIEYAKLLNSYQKLAEREKQLKSKMSMSQLNRLNSISVKLMQEMQKMQQYN